MNSARPNRRSFLGGCAALILAGTAQARPLTPTRAPRSRCAHGGCRHHRPGLDGHGICGLSLHGIAAYEDTP